MEKTLPKTNEKLDISDLPRRQYAITRGEFIERFIEPWDREYIESNGILDRFYTDEVTNYDALLHIFCGEVILSKVKMAVGGFHLESTSPEVNTHAIKIPNANHTETSRSKMEKQDFEPYNIPVVVQGNLKRAPRSIKIRGGERVPINSMFGRAYDAFSIMKTLVDAVDNRDITQDTPTTKVLVRPDIEITSFTYNMPLLGTDETAPIIINLEAGTNKIISAFPILPQNSVPKLGSLSISELNKHLLNN